MRAHSTVARHPVDWACAGDFVSVASMLAEEVTVRFRALGCTGDSGADEDLRSACLPAASRRLTFCFDGVETGIGFAASVSVLSVTLMTWVAKAALSRGLRTWSCGLAVLVLDAVDVFVDRAAAVFVLGGCDSGSGSRSSLRITTVAGEQVDVDETAALTASTFACREAI